LSAASAIDYSIAGQSIIILEESVMPIFEYLCKDCGKNFELLVRGSTVIACPSCDGKKLEKQLSVFAAASGGGGVSRSEMPVAGCGSCGDPRGPGACKMN
jgi:putative FmdB family regulatory protein